MYCLFFHLLIFFKKKQLGVLKFQPFLLSSAIYETVADGQMTVYPSLTNVQNMLKNLKFASGGNSDAVLKVVLNIESVAVFQSQFDEPTQLNVLKFLLNYVLQGLVVVVVAGAYFIF
jgi:hypothetical protein